MKRTALIPTLAVAAAVAAWLFWPEQRAARQSISVNVPALSAVAADGQRLFAANCAVCHGATANGTDQGPPLVHKIYEPDHHADGSFLLAATRGVRAHHWPFGDMPPQPQVSADDVARIVTYVRALQKANGIF